MKPLITLMKREWWEYRSTFLYVPVTLASIFVFLAVIGLLALVIFSVNMTELPSHWQKQFQPDAIPFVFYGLSIIFLTVLWLMVLSYFSTCLFNDRKDGSILFWQSMPISQTQILMAKLITGLVIVPLVMWLCLIICEFLLLILIVLSLKVMEVNVWNMVGQPEVIIFAWLSLLATIIIQGLWLFPLV